MVVAGVALLAENPRPSRLQIVEALQAHVCRCGAYGRIVAAVQLASVRMNGEVDGGSGETRNNGASA
jgi:aerobic-type carbon monoxide dehydrogenase small subunit (CoxS/CutS family)